MQNEHLYYCLLRDFMKVTQDSFIVVDPQGIILDINDKYCSFLGKTREQVIGKPIRDVISTTSMYEVLKTRHYGDGANGAYLQIYGEDDNANHIVTHAVGNRFCFFDEDGTLLGAAAQVIQKEWSAAMTSSFLLEELNYYKEAFQNASMPVGGFNQIIGNSPAIKSLKKQAMRLSARDFPVLITGETGTGKELFAKALHMESPRKNKPIISINCAAIPAELLESELFGYEEGAFTGAKRGGKMGKFQLADGGTVFLDEIGDMPLALQAKLLRVLQEQEIEPVGAGMPIPINVRFIAATRRDLPAMIKEGSFREDLYYRLNVINLELIPLREHREDIVLYANHTLGKLNQKYKTETMLSDAAKCRLNAYDWPGNIRELINVITSAYASCDTILIDEVDLPARLITKSSVSIERKRLPDIVADYEAAVIRDALRRHNHNCRATAEELGIDRSLLYRKIRKAGIKITKVMLES